MVGVFESCTFSTDPFTGERVHKFTFSTSRIVVGQKRVKVVKICFEDNQATQWISTRSKRYWVINIRLRYLSSSGGPRRWLDRAHKVLVKQVIPQRGRSAHRNEIRFESSCKCRENVVSGKY